MPSTLGSRNASLNEYPACYDKAKRALYRLFENVKLVKTPSLQETTGSESHPSEVPLQRQIDSEAVGRTAKKIRPDEIVPAGTQRRKDNMLARCLHHVDVCMTSFRRRVPAWAKQNSL